MSLEGKKILITGSNGFIGRNLKKIGSKMNLQMTTLDLEGSPDIISDITQIKWKDIGLSEFDFVVHLAAKTSVFESILEPEKYFKINAQASKELFSACQENKIERVIFASSAAVYGDSNKDYKVPGEEETTNSPYAESKLLAENYAEKYSFGDTEIISLRFFNVYGPNQPIEGGYSAVIPTFINRACRGDGLVIHGDGAQIRDFIHVNDVCNAIFRGLEMTNPSSSVFNVGTGIGISIGELAKMILYVVEDLNGPKNHINFDDEREGDVKISISDISGSTRILDNSKMISLEQGIRDLVKRTLDDF